MTQLSEYQPVAPQNGPPSTAKLLKILTPEIARALPAGMDADRVARLVMTEIRKNPRLGECTQESFAGALLTASALGLEPGVNGECYLVPYRDNRRRVVECQLIIGYQGIVKLFWQHPRAARVDAQCVYAHDEFRCVKGLNPVLEHVPASGDRGDPVAYYAIVGVTGAEPLWDVFTPEQIAKLRRGNVGPSGDIPDPQRWLERKTALKQVLKLAPKTTRLDLAITADERGGTELARARAIELPATVEAPEDYVDGEMINEVEPTPEHPEVPMATKPQLTKLAIIRGERYPKTDKGRAHWFEWVDSQIGRAVGSDSDLTKAEAHKLIDLLEPSTPTYTPSGMDEFAAETTENQPTATGQEN